MSKVNYFSAITILFVSSIGFGASEISCYYGIPESGRYDKMPSLVGTMDYNVTGPVLTIDGQEIQGQAYIVDDAYLFKGGNINLSIRNVSQVGSDIPSEAVLNGKQAFCF